MKEYKVIVHVVNKIEVTYLLDAENEEEAGELWFDLGEVVDEKFLEEFSSEVQVIESA